MPQVITLGEILADFVPEGRFHTLRPGGAPANVAVNLARLGIKCGMIGKVGDDFLGKFLLDFLKKNRVDTSSIQQTNEAKTGLVFVFINEHGDNDFSFYGEPSADKFLKTSEIGPSALRGCRILHHGSISFMYPRSAAATRKAVSIAKRSGALVSFDPNVRLNLWKGRHAGARKQIVPLFKTADIVKINEKELKFLFDAGIYQSDLERVFEPGQLVFVSCGEKGCVVKHGPFYACVPGKKAKVVDTTGAGDAFVAGVLTCIVRKGKGLDLKPAELYEIAQFANLQGAKAVGRRGAV